MWQGFFVQTAGDRREVSEFLSRLHLTYDFESDVTVVVRHDDRIAATGSLRGNVLQCLGVDPGLQGSGLSAKIVNHLLEAAAERGHARVFAFTRPDNAGLLQGIGFRLLVETPWASFLEIGSPSIDDYVRELAGQAAEVHEGARARSFVVGGLVMNCNPFTLGHQYLVERAATSCDHVFLLVVEEDRSAFPYDIRLELVRKGTAHLPNVTVLPSGPYAVSLATFPSYWSAEETAHARAGASVDAALYGKYIAKALKVTRRYVGTEPLSPVTAIYNEVMGEVLRRWGVELVVVPRLETGGRVVSASLVRQSLRSGDMDSLDTLVPGTTRDFLLSARARDIISRLRTSAGRH